MNDDENITKKVQENKPDSVVSNLIFGAGTIIVIAGPLLIPGVTIIDEVMGLTGISIMIFIVVCILGIWQNLTRNKTAHKRTSRYKQNIR